MPKQRINKTLIETLTRKARPSREVKYHDDQAPGFHIRHLPSGSLTYAMQLARGKAVSLGPITKWDKPEDARAKARKAWQAHQDGLAVTATDVQPVDAAPADGLTVLQLFGLSTRKTADRVEVPGLYRQARREQLQREDRADMRNTMENIYDSLVKFIGGDRPVVAVTQRDIKAWVSMMLARRIVRAGSSAHLSTCSVQRYVTGLRGAFTWAIEHDHITHLPAGTVNPCDGVRVKKTQADLDRNQVVRYLDEAEEQRLRLALHSRDARLKRVQAAVQKIKLRDRDGCPYADMMTPLVLLALYTGGRSRHLRRLQWRHIVRRPIPMVCFEGKAGKKGQTYHVPLNGELQQVLEAWRPAGAAPSDWVFPNPETGEPFKSFDRAWQQVRTIARITNFRFHDLRHSFASGLVQRGVDLFQVSKLMGHKSQRMTERYAHLRPATAAFTTDLLLLPVDACLERMRALTAPVAPAPAPSPAHV